MSEAFAVGDMVTYAGWPFRSPLRCKVIKLMPSENANAVRTYRIRHSSEAFDRAVPESTLTRIEPDDSDLFA